HLPKDGTFETNFTTRSWGRVQLVLSGANAGGPAPVEGVLRGLTIARAGNPDPVVLHGSSAMERERRKSNACREDALLCFVHIHRSGGTAVSDLLRRNFLGTFRQFRLLGRLDRAGRAKSFDSPDEDIRTIISETADPTQEVRAIAGHFTYGLHDKIGRDI